MSAKNGLDFDHHPIFSSPAPFLRWLLLTWVLKPWLSCLPDGICPHQVRFARVLASASTRAKRTWCGQIPSGRQPSQSLITQLAANNFEYRLIINGFCVHTGGRRPSQGTRARLCIGLWVGPLDPRKAQSKSPRRTHRSTGTKKNSIYLCIKACRHRNA